MQFLLRELEVAEELDPEGSLRLGCHPHQRTGLQRAHGLRHRFTVNTIGEARLLHGISRQDAPPGRGHAFDDIAELHAAEPGQGLCRGALACGGQLFLHGLARRFGIGETLPVARVTLRAKFLDLLQVEDRRFEFLASHAAFGDLFARDLKGNLLLDGQRTALLDDFLHRIRLGLDPHNLGLRRKVLDLHLLGRRRGGA